MVKRINELIKDIDRNGLLIGTGKPEPLKYRKACSRRITDEHRLVSNMIAHCIHDKRMNVFFNHAYALSSKIIKT